MACAATRHVGRQLVAALLLLALNCSLRLQSVAAEPRPPPVQRPPPPQYLDDDSKELWVELEETEEYYADSPCEMREKLLKNMAGKGDGNSQNDRARILLGIAICEFKKGNWETSKKRFENMISELNIPNEEVMMSHVALAPIALTKQAANALLKLELTQAATYLRRCREVIDRNLRKVLKSLKEQMGDKGPPLEVLIEELPGYGKTGKILPAVVKQTPMMKQDLLWAEIIDNTLDSIDRRITAVDPAQKSKKERLAVSKGQIGKGGLLYVRGLATEPVISTSRCSACQELTKTGAIEAFLEEAANAEKSAMFVTHSKQGSGCKEDKGFGETCQKLFKVPDVHTNNFGETRLIIVKAGKKVTIDECVTNANIGIFIAAKDGVTLKVAEEEATPLSKGQPVVIDICRLASLESDENIPVLSLQAWHPEFAPVERTTELRQRAGYFLTSEDHVKAAVKAVNDHAKKHYEKNAALWRMDSPFLENLRSKLREEVEGKKKEEEEKAEAKRRQIEASDEDKKKALEELERKREAKRKAKEQAEEAKKLRMQQLAEERAKRDPWLNFPEVREAEKRLEELKDARRDANAKLEFDLSTKLTKDITAQERALKKIIKQAKKKHLAGAAGEPAGADAPKGEEAEKKQEETEETVETKAEVKAEKKPETKAEKKSDTKPEKKSETKAEKTAETKAEKKSETKADKKAEPKKEKVEKPAKENKPKKAASSGAELEKLKKKLEEVKVKKAEAAEAEDFQTAKKLKDEEKELANKIKKLEQDEL